MKKSLIYALLLGIFLYMGAGELSAQKVRLDKWVLGSGGMIEAKNSANLKMSGVVGQIAIERIKGTYNGRSLDVWQGFWVPSGTVTGVDTPVDPVADGGMVNYPNPVSYSTTIRYSIPGTSNVTLKVYNVAGNLMKVLVDEIQEAGQKEVAWDVKDQTGQELSSGSYMYELSVNPAQMAGGSSFQPFTLRNVMIVVK